MRLGLFLVGLVAITGVGAAAFDRRARRSAGAWVRTHTVTPEAVAQYKRSRRRKGKRGGGLGASGRDAWEIWSTTGTAFHHERPPFVPGRERFPATCREAFEEGYEDGKGDKEEHEAFCEEHWDEQVPGDYCREAENEAEENGRDEILNNISEHVPDDYCDDSNRDYCEDNYSDFIDRNYCDEAKEEAAKEAKDEAEEEFAEKLEEAKEELEAALTGDKKEIFEQGRKRGAMRYELMRTQVSTETIPSAVGALAQATYSHRDDCSHIHTLAMAIADGRAVATLAHRLGLTDRTTQLLTEIGLAAAQRHKLSMLCAPERFAPAAREERFNRAHAEGMRTLEKARQLFVRGNCQSALREARNSVATWFAAQLYHDDLTAEAKARYAAENRQAVNGMHVADALIVEIAQDCERAGGGISPRPRRGRFAPGAGPLEIEGPFRRRRSFGGLRR